MSFKNIYLNRILSISKLVLLAILVGVVVGVVGGFFNVALEYVAHIRQDRKILFYLLPLAGVLVVLLYRLCGIKEDEGTNEVMHAVSSDINVKGRRSFLIFISTLITHLFGASAGREGAALQLGGSLTNTLSRVLKLNDASKKLMVMMGMSCCFTTLFGTPIAATIFSVAVVNVGIIYYGALFPCLLASFIGKLIAVKLFGISYEAFIFEAFPAFGLSTGLKSGVVSAIAALVSIIFCLSLHFGHDFFKKALKNPYLRAFIGSFILVGAALIFGDRYQSAGTNLIEISIHGDARYYDFILKMFFTVVSISICFKGGEIVPSLAIGATLGGFISSITGYDLSLCVAVSMISMFCGITNCPIASIFLGLELFKSYEVLPYLAIAVAVSYVVSGYIGVYESQLVSLSKYSIDTLETKVD